MVEINVHAEGSFEFNETMSVPDDEAGEEDIGEWIEKRLKRNPNLPQGLDVYIEDVDVT